MTGSGTGKTALTPALPSRRSGFTLVEILFALAIVAILTGISLPIYNNYIERAKLTVSISTLQTVRLAIEDYHINHGVYPPAIDISTGEDGQGNTVLQPALLAEFKLDLFSLESYAVAAADYTLTARAKDAKHTLLVLTPGQAINQGP